MGEHLSRRNEKIDVLRGSAVLLMVWGHTIQFMAAGNLDVFGNEAFRFIYSFHMPLFMILSGYVYGLGFDGHSVKELIIGRLWRIVYPCILWGSAIYLFKQGLNLAQGEITFALLLRGWPAALTEYWFLWGVGVYSFLFLPYKKLAGWGFAVLQVPLLVLVSFLPNSSSILYMYPYFFCGFFIGHRNGKTKPQTVETKWVITVSALLYPVLLLHYRTEHYIYETGVWLSGMQGGVHQIGIDVFRWLIGFSGIAFIFILTETLLKQYGKYLNRLKQIFMWMGRISLEIYLVQGFLFSQVAVRLLYHIPVDLVRLCGGKVMYTYLFCPVVTALLIGGIGLFVWLINKSKVIRRILMGK